MQATGGQFARTGPSLRHVLFILSPTNSVSHSAGPLADAIQTLNPEQMQSVPANSPIRVAVIGAGCSGLAAAIRAIDLASSAGRALELRVFEAGPAVGGLVASQRIGDYFVERGADSFITNKSAGVAMCRRLRLESRLIPTDPRFRQSFILSGGRPVPTPAGFQLIAPTRIKPFLKSPLLSWRGKKRVLAEPEIPRRTDTGEESVGAFVRRRFGNEAFDRVVQPLVGGIYTGDLDRLSLAATFPRFAQMERRVGSILKALRRQRSADTSGARYGLFVSLPGGMAELLDGMATEIRRDHYVLLNSRVDAMSRGPSGEWRLRVAGETLLFDAVIVALPAYHAAPLVAVLDAPLAESLDAIEYSSSAIVVSGHRLADVRHPLNGAGLVIPRVERRRILAVSFASRKFPGRAPDGRVILRTFLGGALQLEQLAHDDATLQKIVLEELGEILGVQGTPDFCEVVRYPRGIPQFVIGHLDRVAQIEAIVNELHGLALAGNAYHGVGIPDAIKSGVSAAEKVWTDLTGTAVPPFIETRDHDSIATHSPSGDDLADSGHHSAAGLTQ